MNRIAIAVIIASLALVGCNEPKIDTSTDERAEQSLKEVQAKLNDEEKRQFKSAILVIAMNGASISDMMLHPENHKDMPDKSMLNGLTAKQVIAKAETIKTERTTKEISELEAKKSKTEQDKVALKKFVIHKAQFYKRDEGTAHISRMVPIIEMDIQNTTGKPISRAHFKGTLSSPGRSVPWLVETFNYKISGGLENGERTTWSLQPSAHGDWGRVEAPKDAIFSVEVVRLDGADGKPLYDATFSESDQKRLDTLKEARK